MTTVVRPASLVDADRFAACHLACWQEAYASIWGAERLAQWDVDTMAATRRKEMSDGIARHVLVERDGEVIGVAIAGPSRDDDAPTDIELFAIYLRRQYYGSGLADELLDAVIGDAPACLWVYRDNSRATAFYVNRGFIPDGCEHNDSEGIQAIRMVRR